MAERLRNGEFYAEGAKVFKAPVWTKNDEGGSTVSIGFHACTATDWCEPAGIVACLNASRHHEALVKALTAMLDQFGGYCGAPGCDEAIGVMQTLGLDRWSMQSQMERSAINANVPEPQP